MSAPGTAMLELQDLATNYGAIRAVDGISLHVDTGEIVTLIGANGAGKTSTLMTICGNPRASGGRVLLEGEDITWLPSYTIMRKGIAISPEGRRMFPGLTVLENLHMGGFFLDRAEIERQVAHVYELFPRLQEREGQRAGTLSGGEQQMLAIGRALMTNPVLLILDEATEGLAPLIVREIWRVIGQIRESGIATLVVDRNFRAVLNHTDHAVVLEKGQIIMAGESDTLAAQDEERFHAQKLREIVLSRRRDGVYELAFLLVDPQAGSAGVSDADADSAAGEIPEYIMVEEVQ